MPDSPVEKIKERLDIVDLIQGYIKLNKAGANYKAKCPFHSDSDPSFYVSPTKQIWHCFGCGLGGDVFDFVMEAEGVDFREALKILSDRTGVELEEVDPELRSKKEKLYDITEAATDFFQKELQNSSKAQKYLQNRGLKETTIDDFRLGYAPDSWRDLKEYLLNSFEEENLIAAGLLVEPDEESNAKSSYDRFRGRIMFPIFSVSSQVIGFSGRVLPKENKDGTGGKYINTPNTLIYDKSKVLYGLDRAKVEIRKLDHAILTEGNLDVILSHQAGLKNAVATSGTSLTNEHLKIIKRYTSNIKMAFDFDQAGERAIERGLKEALALEMNVKVVASNEAEDPAELIKKNPEKWIEACKNAENFVGYFFSQLLEKYPNKDVEAKKKIAQKLLPIIKSVQNKVERAHWIQKLSDELEIEQSYLEEALKETEKATKEAETNLNKKRKIKTNASPKRKEQIELLEKELLTLALEYRDKLDDLIAQEEADILNSKTRKKIFKIIQDTDAGGDFDFPLELEDKVKVLQFRSQFISFKDDKELLGEFENIIKGIKRNIVKKNLNKVSRNIEIYERKGEEEKLEKALKKHSELTEKLSKLE